MPRISAATVADHRANRHAALLEAAREILAAEGVHALTPAAVGARIGLARSSVYRYFASTADILAQLVEDAFPRWAARLRAAIDPGAGADGSLPARIRAYGRAALDFVGSPDYALIPALQAIGLPGECRVRVDELHGELVAPLADALREAGTDHPELRAELAWGVLRAGARRLMPDAPEYDPPADPDAIVEITLDVLTRALR
ncbi:TetR family transcriptional regulator [Microbispora rosea subsp. aerata]|nr:TetR/AcrR family transcriptional regulator [Microbispora rosea]GGO00858.1 TetR family transcriptional regulator [Microbispora rosea subsp. aerata]GIH56457.1 TetR family transcriptional regulator [Microbispora rosea subsp. aerata]GLJ84376.1 TetR family transcriptional regulator [Microbispora rosea subsp. aerata]